MSLLRYIVAMGRWCRAQWVGALRPVLARPAVIAGLVWFLALLIRFGSKIIISLGEFFGAPKRHSVFGLFEMLHAASRWPHRRVRRFIFAWSALEELSVVAPAMKAMRLQSVFDVYWLRQTLHREFPEMIAPRQRPLVWLPGLKPQAFFDRSQFAWSGAVEQKTSTIKAELANVLAKSSAFQTYRNEVGLDFHPFSAKQNHGVKRYEGDAWKVLYLYRCGKRDERNAALCPETVRCLEDIPGLDKTMVMFSALQSCTWIPPHFGLCNGLVRVHLPLTVPQGCEIRVGDETASWREGELLIFDDSFEHQVWNYSNECRIVLFFNVFHPDLKPQDVAVLKKFLYEELPLVPAAKFWDEAQGKTSGLFGGDADLIEQHIRREHITR